MPPLARIVGLILVLAFPAGLWGQTAGDADEPLLPARPGLFPRLETRADRARKDSPSDETSAHHPAGGREGNAPSSPLPAPLAPASKTEPSKTPPAPQPGGDLPPLSPPKQAGPGKEGSRWPAGLTTLTNIGGSLALVLGLFFILAWVLRRSGPGQYPLLPKEALEVLGRAPLAARQQVHLIRLGSKLILVSVTADGVEALTEVTDPAEVDRLAGLCHQAQSHSSTANFRQVLQQFDGSRPTETGRA